MAWFSTEKHDISLDGVLVTIVEFVVDSCSGTVQHTSRIMSLKCAKVSTPNGIEITLSEGNMR